MCCIAMNCKKCLIMCVMIDLIRLCYVILLSGYLGNVLIVQPFLQKNVVCSDHEKTPHFKQPSA
jgi:myo-inositol-1-phosphate synthase